MYDDYYDDGNDDDLNNLLDYLKGNSSFGEEFLKQLIGKVGLEKFVKALSKELELQKFLDSSYFQDLIEIIKREQEETSIERKLNEIIKSAMDNNTITSEECMNILNTAGYPNEVLGNTFGKNFIISSLKDAIKDYNKLVIKEESNGNIDILFSNEDDSHTMYFSVEEYEKGQQVVYIEHNQPGKCYKSALISQEGELRILGLTCDVTCDIDGELTYHVIAGNYKYYNENGECVYNEKDVGMNYYFKEDDDPLKPVLSAGGPNAFNRKNKGPLENDMGIY